MRLGGLADIVVQQATIHCFPKRIDQSVKKASDGGASETKEHWVYDVTIENKTFKELTNLDLKYGSEIRGQRSEVRESDLEKRKLNSSSPEPQAS
jgi:hypothetical protein